MKTFLHGLGLWLVIFLAVLAALAIAGLYVQNALQQESSGVTSKLGSAGKLLSLFGGSGS